MGKDKQPNEGERERRRRRRELRKNATKAERLMWSGLRNRRLGGLKFRRQYSIGPHIVDFVCVERKLVVEIDGLYHDYVQAADRQRQRYLECKGYRVMRFSNEEVLEDAESVINAIAKALSVDPSPLPPADDD